MAAPFQATNPADRGNGAVLALALLFPAILEPYELDAQRAALGPAERAWLPCHKPHHQSAGLFGRRAGQWSLAHYLRLSKADTWLGAHQRLLLAVQCRND